MAVGVSAQGAKVTITDFTAKVEVIMPVEKALKTAVNSSILARQSSKLTVIHDDKSISVFTVDYINSAYKLTERVDNALIETFESTRVADIRQEILKWLDTP